MSLTKVSYSMINGAPFNVRDYGAVGDGVADDTVAIEAAITAASAAVGGQLGAIVYFPTGTYLISNTVIMPNRVGLQGANGRGVVIKPHPTFADPYMFHANNGIISMFGSWIRDMFIDSRGFNMTGVIWTQAWQETCGMERVTIIFDGTTQYGVLYTDGYGGASYCKFSDCEIFSETTAINGAGVLITEVSSVGGFVFEWDGGSITGNVGFNLPSAIRMENDTLLCKLLHCEYVENMVVMSGVGGLSADTLTGSFNDVVNVVSLASTFTGVCNLRNIIPNGATGNTLDDGVSGRDIPASEGMIAEYTYQPSAFAVKLSADINNVTGNGTEYTVLFNNEIYDYLNEYVAATGRFTPKRTGKYLLSCCLKMNIPSGSTTALVRIATSNFTYEIYRGSFANQVDASGKVTINGAVIADMDVNDIAFIQVLVSGIGADTVDIFSGNDGSFFSGHFISR